MSQADGGPSTMEDTAVGMVVNWFSANARPLPWRERRDIYGVWVSEVMSAQTTVSRAAAAWERWMRRWPTVEALAGASLAEVLSEWQGLGYPRRARDLLRTAQFVAAAGWPDDLRILPGIGPYTESAIRCFALEEPVLPRDVNVSRVLERRFPGGVDTSGLPWLPAQALMEFGQRICTRRPRCELCPVSDGCAGPSAESRGRRQKPFEGSLRQRRGRLLRRVLAEGGVPLPEADTEAAAGLLADGLLSISAGRLTPAG